MTDTKYYVTILVGFGIFFISAVVCLNLYQPPGVDVEIWNRITAPATTIIGLLVLLISNKSDRKVNTQENKEIKEVTAVAAIEANTAARIVAKATGAEVPPVTTIVVKKEEEKCP